MELRFIEWSNRRGETTTLLIATIPEPSNAVFRVNKQKITRKLAATNAKNPLSLQGDIT